MLQIKAFSAEYANAKENIEAVYAEDATVAQSAAISFGKRHRLHLIFLGCGDVVEPG